MINELITLIRNQDNDLQELLELLETQYKMIMSKDVFGLEGLVDEINECGKKIAKVEVERRKLIGGKSMPEIVNSSDNKELKEVYRDIGITMEKTTQQKDTNDILLKQQIMFTNKMLNIMNPSREIKTYNSYGNLSR
ncbi:flagellar protein FlgN [Clostridium beijerinckii]|jgi:Flagellar biosynthesis/type III secretory pathway chaperone|uniref:Flagellar protein FlgN n=2 Tax=Clostridium beijerinckii TaxID=1520 RepID=A0AAE2UVI8_CLOBE|nr:flagellar protein FlgN [Clostridium beijerinckii]ABR36409.1 FlgN family protein [Clostridium beijerinckii NCIMB 8052]AIU02283.1 FlgN family protein [Clostridium beijerinckii ATCC 35702]MBF7808944.1 flagellar protein FlgN [Clostridium beijerinckii]NRT22525.1 flagellar biosynthesis/type III secretory pathway chaperone [Clostridium beijerinckii]NRT64959.1 flagellar biosynthesis/type III secretory pathway chaperone [Clostridium beijerinckii]